MTDLKKCDVVGKKPVEKYRGKVKRNYQNDKDYTAFLGISYAKKPEGLKRYQAPESLPCPETAELGEGSSTQPTSTYKANVKGKISTQMRGPYYKGSSDCLYLNIFVPDRPEKIHKLLPVLVFIHGGGFIYGSNSHEIYTPDSIIRYDVVFVTINYRLGLFGFLNTHTEDCPGNAGLKDQVKALEWIRDNIECFKGDPKNVTISGNSAGATCVNLHLIAPASQDLFHKAIVQSGGVFATWGFRGHRREQKRMLLRDTECRNLLFAQKESKALQKCACHLIEEDRLLRHPKAMSPYFGPSVETFREEAFIPDDIKEMMKKVEHDKPIMAGITKHEGIYPFVVSSGIIDVSKWINDDQEFRDILMDNFRWSSVTARKLLEEIRNKYFPNRMKLTRKDIALCFANLSRDIFFREFYDNFKFGSIGKLHKNLYVYRFDHVSELSAVKSIRRLTRYFDDATHGDELKYLYCPVEMRRKFKISTGIPAVTDHICSLWANFCKTGVPKSDFAPDVEWRRHTEEKPCYLSISENLVLKEESLFKREWDWLNARVKNQPTVKSEPATPE